MLGLTEVLKLFGFATPFIYAAATYGFFRWLDKKASGPAKKALSGWLVPKQYDRAALRGAVLELFDRVYTQPLFDLRAFFRSALITISVTLVAIFHARLPHTSAIIRDPEFSLDVIHTTRLVVRDYTNTIFIVNVIFDYIALFIIRSRLADSRITPFLALTIGPLLGVLFVALCIFARTCIGLLTVTQEDDYWWLNIDIVLPMIMDQYYLTTSASALVVHLWLPYFALCVSLVKGLNYLLLAVNKAQWFLKRGKDHPLEAIGFVAAPLMFLGAVAVQMLVSR